MKQLEHIISQFCHVGLKINRKNYQMTWWEVTFFRYYVSAEELKLDPELLQAIHEIKATTCFKELCSLLRFSKSLSVVCKDILNQRRFSWIIWKKQSLRKGGRGCQQQAFHELKRLLSSPIMAFPNVSKTCRVYTNASVYSLGEVLAQNTDGKEKFICCSSHSLNHAERNYSTTVVWGLSTFRHFFIGHTTEILMDHSNFHWLYTMEEGITLLQKCQAKLEEFQYTVLHHPEYSWGRVDGLSWLPKSVHLITPDHTVLHKLCNLPPLFSVDTKITIADGLILEHERRIL